MIKILINNTMCTANPCLIGSRHHDPTDRWISPLGNHHHHHHHHHHSHHNHYQHQIHQIILRKHIHIFLFRSTTFNIDSFAHNSMIRAISELSVNCQCERDIPQYEKNIFMTFIFLDKGPTRIMQSSSANQINKQMSFLRILYPIFLIM